MDELDAAEAILDDLGRHIAQELKRALMLYREAAIAAREAAVEQPSDDDFMIAFGPVAPGTRGRACLEALSRAGGVLSVAQLARLVPPAEDAATDLSLHLTRLRGILRHLARDEHGYVKSPKRGVWQVTPKGRRVMEQNAMMAEISLAQIGEAIEKRHH